MATTASPTRPRAESNWPAFVDAYGRAILDWFRQSGLSSSEIEFSVRELMQELCREFTHLSAAPALKFRSWLQTAGQAALNRLAEAAPEQDLFLSTAARERFLQALDAECTHQRRREVLPRVQLAIGAADWERFYEVVLAQVPEAEVATRFRGTPQTVRAAVFRVYRALEQELQRMEMQI